MASYWKSNPRYFCEVCKCWLSDNKASIEFHERGKSHKEKKEKHITEIRKRSAEDYANQQQSGKYLRQMEDAALQAYKKDLAEKGMVLDGVMPHMASSRPSAGIHGYHFVDAPTKKNKPIKIHNASDFKKPPKTSPWSLQTSPEGQEYYWNSETGASQWEKPEGYVTEEPPGAAKTAEEEKVTTSSHEKKSSKSSWVKHVSPEGNPYFWNTETGKSQWEEPENFVETEEETTKDLKDEEQQAESLKESEDSIWTEEVSPDGHTYYWNRDTGKSQWEKPDGYVAPKLTFTPAEGESNGDKGGDALTRKPRRDPYGSWSVVKAPKPKKHVDWQLPSKNPNPAEEGLVDRTALESSYEPEPSKFNEKIVSLGENEGGSAVFKKKTSKQRSIRRRNEDD